MKRSVLTAGCLAALGASALATAATDARARGRIVSVQGAAGDGYLKQRSISRSDGSVSWSVSRTRLDGTATTTAESASLPR